MSEAALYVVATPIGNLEEMSPRAQAVLKEVDLIAAEDTRHCKQLLKHFSIQTPSLSLHEHNESQRIDQLLNLLAAGKKIALVSDAGTPLISDPGYLLVRQVRSAGYPVIPVAGPCALISALSASGLASDRFYFEGFLPAKTVARQKRLQALADYKATLIFYEAPHRILETLADALSVFGGERQACIAREISKTYETFYTASLSEVQAWLCANPQQVRGEFVFLVEACKANTSADTPSEEAQHLLELLLQEGLALKRACHLVANVYAVKKNHLYQWKLQQSSGCAES
ncbi:16S rRNA (cytidine1402-2'-O)-methyltransferase [Allopseudospirillum japonicum]|uniref:Ribosomal RNA small subunit methyltransferase I n=1 Tax=Allopseudospirillum japonicum TaxID=64971 RepID=A0A1H6QKI4_9GAMM|nr:16S rRNA (cytidine(1402)-2'-O)-methyltransferase [Allopseudospirillum japonicum]SEI40637.1 16S rRNA (cytidine1402-2'-O)-methyltransferase [Allopseudospirillum japonicum]